MNMMDRKAEVKLIIEDVINSMSDDEDGEEDAKDDDAKEDSDEDGDKQLMDVTWYICTFMEGSDAKDLLCELTLTLILGKSTTDLGNNSLSYKHLLRCVS